MLSLPWEVCVLQILRVSLSKTLSKIDHKSLKTVAQWLRDVWSKSCWLSCNISWHLLEVTWLFLGWASFLCEQHHLPYRVEKDMKIRCINYRNGLKLGKVSEWMVTFSLFHGGIAWSCFPLPLSFHLRRTDHLNNYWELVLSHTSLTTWERNKICIPWCEENYLASKSNRHAKSIGIPPNNNHRMW